MSSRWVLRVVGSQTPPTELPRSGVLTIGSSEEAAFRVAGRDVAEVHCAIGRVKGGGYALKDLGSQVGTFLNGERIESARLSAEDTITLGEVDLLVVDPTRPATLPAERPSPEATPRLTGYRFVRPLGRGSTGRVYLAVQENLGRHVALKILPPGLAADTDFVERFLAEARAAAALNHPNVVTVHDVGVENGQHFLSMEYMAGGSLEARLARAGKLSWTEVLEILRDAASGLVFAAKRGIVHRDIKPANLMQDEVGTTKIADLGLATHLEAEATETSAGRIFGTPHFISPEQARGETVDPRADLYSLGATAYQLLTGSTPFEGATTREILRGHFLEEPEPLSARVPEAPERLVELVHRLLRKKPEERVPSAAILLEELDRLRSETRHGVGASRGRGLLVGTGLAILSVGAIAWRVVRGGEGEDPLDPTPWEAPVDVAPSGLTPEPGSGSSEDLAATSPADEEDDRDLKLLELTAELSYRDLSPDLTPVERRLALLELAEEFAGTTLSSRARAEAESFANAQDEDAIEREKRRGAALAILAAMRDAAALGGEPASPAEAAARLQALIAVEGQAGLFEAADLAERARIYGELCASLAASMAETLHEAREAEQRGDFEGARAILEAAGPYSELPTLPDRLGARAHAALVEGADQLAFELGDLAYLERLFRAEQEREDVTRVASTLRAPGHLARDLEQHRLAAAEARLEELSRELSTPLQRSFVLDLLEDARLGRAAFETLTKEYRSGGWRRRSVADPRARRSRVASVIAAEGQGLSLEGTSEPLGWGDYAGRTKELHQLFHERLRRDYTEGELRGIAFLLRASVAARVADLVTSAWESSDRGSLGEDRSSFVAEAFEFAGIWAERAGSTDRLEEERAASNLLLEGISLASREAWSSAGAVLQRALDEHGNTLVVHLLSDGAGLAPPLPVRPPAPPAPPPEAVPGSGDSAPEESASGSSAPGAEDDDDAPDEHE